VVPIAFGTVLRERRVSLILITLVVTSIVFSLTLVLVNLRTVVFPTTTFLVVHTILEVFTVCVSFSIFAVRWSSMRPIPDSQSLFIGVAFFSVAIIHVLHFLTYSGMPVFLESYSVSTPVHYWMLARLTFAVALLAAAFLPSDRTYRWVPPPLTLVLFTVYTLSAILLVALYSSELPAMIVPGEGLTAIKIGLEYVAIALMAAAVCLYWRIAARTGELMYFLLASALVLGIFEELSFTLYKSVFDAFNLLGHLFGFVSFLFIYLALFRSSVRRPYEKLQEAKGEVESRTKEAETAKLKAQTYLDFLSHDITNILSPITLYGELISKNEKAPPEVRRYAAKILSQGELTASFVTNLRRFTQAERSAPAGFKPLDLRKALSEAESEVRKRYPGKRFDIAYAVPGAGPITTIGAGYIEDVVDEVFDNAAKHSPGHEVRIEVGVESVVKAEEGPYWRMVISDHGPGIPDEAKVTLSSDVFDPEKRLARGIASKLSFMSLVVEQMGGEMRIVDRVRGDHTKGTKVVLTLPARV